MASTVYDRILKRELGYSGVRNTRYSKVRGIYGDRKWVEDLDIVNELSGHSGCVNAISWSRSGRLLASGSDDQHINLHTYLPEASTSQFQFTTTIATGHRANIFSVKFMPNSGDRTVVSAAGDREVRIFDIEYAGRGTTTGLATEHRSARDHTFNGVRYLSEGDTNAKVFRSHSDRVKRIVTESSPYFFLTCSEDGEVRQWDTRQPSSAYPAPRDRITSRRLSAASEDVPPPLISYKRYNLDLNTISCSASQPHYIALGGAHLHCFLHDRRMIGRDRLLERGLPPTSPASSSQREEDMRDQATYCVKRFAPNGKRTMRRHDSGHITACKISDAHPNELIVSWSGDWIYSFDINRTPDARHEIVPYTSVDNGKSTRRKDDVLRKRKRTGPSASTEGEGRASSRARTESVGPGEEEMALMVQYENGQSEEIAIESRRPRTQAADEALGEAEKESYRIAKASVKVRKYMFSLASSWPITVSNPTGHATSFTSVLGLCGSILPDMDDAIRSWRYPVDPTELEIEFQNRLRGHRGSARRLIQASGTLARALGGELRMGGSSNAMISKYFSVISPAPNERKPIPRHEQFGYDFLKAVLLWLDSGIGALVEGFSPSATLPGSSPRCPIPPDATAEAVDEYLIPYLLRLASTEPVMNVDASWLEPEANRVAFASEKAAVISFAQALKIPFADLSSAMVPASPDGPSNSVHASAQDRKTALKFWAFKVGRGLLMNAAKGVNFEMVDNAFGGLGRGDATIVEEETALAEKFQLHPRDDEDPVVQRATLVRRESHTRSAGLTSQVQVGTSGAADMPSTEATVVEEGEGSEDHDRVMPLQELQNAARDLLAEASDEDEDNGDASSEDEQVDGEDDEEDDATQRIFWRSGYSRGMPKEKVESKVPCGTHTRVFQGHCNVKTVKDVNFYGLEDEYVVSGSDSGHLFIWDRKTSKLLNILEGDGEVVNVVQGHPYEPVLAVSGIDHTVKIFSSDARSREDARKGVGVSAADASDFSSIFHMRMRRRQAAQPDAAPTTMETQTSDSENDGDSDDDAKVAPTGLRSRKRIADEYRITSENDNQRRGGNADALVTQSMLMQIAAHLRERQAAGHDNDLPIVLPGAGNDGDCSVM